MIRFECYICGKIHSGVLSIDATETYTATTISRPVGWEKDSQGRERCPKHRETNKPLATLGEILQATKRSR